MNNKPITVLSLFDGVSCGQLALNRAGIKYDKYYASEIDKYAIKIAQKNYPDTIQLGSVIDVDVSKLPPIDWLQGGSPCTNFSFAGKRKGMSTTDEVEILTLDHYLELKSQNYEFEGQSYLFWEYMRILTDIQKYNPDVIFFLENVEMGEKWEKVLSRAIGVNGIHINSALVSAQSRPRIYWTNLGLEKSGLFGDLTSIITQPKDRGIYLKDILETNVDEKYYLSDKMVSYLNSRKKNYNGGKINYKTGVDKASCINACSGSLDISDNIIVDKNRKASCFTAGAHSGGLHSEMDTIVEGQSTMIEVTCAASRGRNPDNPKSRKTGLETEQHLEERFDGKTNCLTSVAKDNYVVEKASEPVLMLTLNKSAAFHHEKLDNKSYSLAARSDLAIVEPITVHNMMPRSSKTGKGGTGHLSRTDGKTYTLACSDINRVEYKQRIRRLTEVECERLQTLPDFYTEGISSTQRYRALGNGWNVDTIVYLFGYYKG